MKIIKHNIMQNNKFTKGLITLQAIILITVLSSCSQKNIMKDTVKVTPATYIDSLMNITYKSIDGKELKLDIYSLQGDTVKSRPTVIYIHGGSWTRGDKSWIHFTSRQCIANALIKEHYNVVSVNYRLADGKTTDFISELSDCRDAIKWVRRNAAKYNINPDKIALWGTSAGAHLSLVCGYQPTDSTKVNFILDFYGPTDLNKLFRTSLTPIGEGAAKLAMPKLYKERQTLMKIFHNDFCDIYSPINMVSRYSTPTLILHGKKDHLVPIKQAYELEERLTLHRAPHQMFIYPKAAHGFNNMSQEEINDIVNQSVNFAKKYF